MTVCIYCLYRMEILQFSICFMLPFPEHTPQFLDKWLFIVMVSWRQIESQATICISLLAQWVKSTNVPVFQVLGKIFYQYLPFNQYNYDMLGMRVLIFSNWTSYMEKKWHGIINLKNLPIHFFPLYGIFFSREPFGLLLIDIFSPFSIRPSSLSYLKL